MWPVVAPLRFAAQGDRRDARGRGLKVFADQFVQGLPLLLPVLGVAQSGRFFQVQSKDRLLVVRVQLRK